MGDPKIANLSRTLLGKMPYLLLIAILFLIIIFNYSSINTIKLMDYLLKSVGWMIILLWMPFWFLRIMSGYPKSIMTALSFAAICILFAYKSIMGIILVSMLVILPILLLFYKRNNLTEYDSNKLRKLIFFPLFASLTLSFLITREPIWFAGIIIWGIWVFTSNISYNYFRPVFDILSKHDSKRDEINKGPFVFISILLSGALVFLVSTSEISIDFLRDLYLASSQISMTLVGFLLAVQGVLSNASLKSKTDKGIIFEKELILRSMDGLKGFMLIFITLFIISMLGVFSTKTDIGFLQLNTIWIVEPIILDLENIILFLDVMLFICFTTMFSFSICYLYYLFLSNNLIVLPFKLSLLSNPVVIEKISNSASDKTLEENIIIHLTNESSLNGKLIRNVSINELDGRLLVTCEMEVNFPDKNDLMLTTRVLSKLLIEKLEIMKVNIWVRSMQGKLGLIKIFQVELDMEKLNALEEIKDPQIMEQKFKEFGAHFKDFAFKEAQLL